MTDQCKYCVCRGDINECLSAECFHHENWHAKQQAETIKELTEHRDYLEQVDLGTTKKVNSLIETIKELEERIETMVQIFERVASATELGKELEVKYRAIARKGE